MASKSSTLAVEGAADSKEDWISSALVWASVTFFSASSMNFLRTVYTPCQFPPCHPLILDKVPYLDGSHVGVLGDVLVLVQAILGSLSFTEFDAEFDKQQHHGLERGDRAAARPLGGDMFVQDIQGSRGLAHGDKFLSPLKNHHENIRVSHLTSVSQISSPTVSQPNQHDVP